MTMDNDYDIWGQAQALSNQAHQDLGFTGTDSFGGSNDLSNPFNNPNNLGLGQDDNLALSGVDQGPMMEGSGLDLNALGHHQSVALNSVHGNCGSQPYLSVNQRGDIYRHDRDHSFHQVGYVRNNVYYNNHWDEIGYLKDGHYYDASHHHLQGSICGTDVYDNHHYKIAVADTATEGGAWIAFIQHGGIA